MPRHPSPLARTAARLGLLALLAAAGPGLAADGGGHGGGMGGGGGRGGGIGGSGGLHGGDIRIRGGRGGSAGGPAAAGRGLGGGFGRTAPEAGRDHAGPEGDRRELRGLAERELRLRTSRCDRNITERYNAPHSCNESPPLGRFPSAVGDDGF